MAITTAVCNSFKKELAEGTHDFSADTIKIALYSSSASLDADTTAYTTTNEVTGTGYTAGGATLTVTAPAISGNTVVIDFDDASWAASTITARGALIYNSTQTNKAIAVINFGADYSTTNGTLTITFPAATATAAILRIT